MGKKNTNKSKKRDSFDFNEEVVNEKGSRSGKYRTDREHKYGKNSPHNDWSWYCQNETILNQTANIYQTVPIGQLSPRQFNTDTVLSLNSSTHPSSNLFGTPGIFVADTWQGIGKASVMEDAVNQSAMTIFSKLRGSNTNNVSYDQADVMMLIIAYDSIFSIFCAAQRAIKLTNAWSDQNKYEPKFVFEKVAGCSYDDFIANKNKYVGLLNSIAVSAMTFKVPAHEFSIFERHAFSYTHWYTDNPSNAMKGQFYALRPAGWYIWDDQSDPNGTCLTYNYMTYGNTRTFEDVYITPLKTMINAVLGSSDAYTISSDVAKAFGAGGVYTFDTNNTVDQVQAPVYDYDTLMQIKNATVFAFNTGDPTNQIAALKISQDPNTRVIKATPKFAPSIMMKTATAASTFGGVFAFEAAAADRLIDMGPQEGDAKRIMEYTYFTNIIDDSGSSQLPDNKGLVSVGTANNGEVMLNAHIYYYDNVGQGTSLVPVDHSCPVESFLLISENPNISGYTLWDVARMLSLYANFEFTPYALMVNAWYTSSTSNGFEYITESKRHDNFFYLTKEVNARLKNQMILGLWGIKA